MCGHAWCVLEIALGTLDTNDVADFELGDVFGDIAFLVRLKVT